MKKLIILVSLMLFGIGTFAQQKQEMPLDPAVRVGKLENGLTYFIRQNANPEKRAEFYIATNVGAINETPAQRGLAHFLEHMCFNGNKDFPGNTMLSYLEKNGLIFGANINAMTGVEMTCYTLSTIPTDKQFLIDTALVILQNDAAFVTNDFDEVEKERGVIIEEWRSGNTAQRRQQEALFKVLFKGTKYADCNIIGDEQCLTNFNPQELVDFYKTWYYPGNQAIIVVGDVDPDYIEGKIKEYFSIIPKKAAEPQKEVIFIPDNEEPLSLVFTDPEINTTQLMMITKEKALPKAMKTTPQYFVIDAVKDLVASMLNERLSDASKKPDAPFIQASYSNQNLCETMDAGLLGAAIKDNRVEDAVNTLVGIVRQAEKYGFTEDEFERAKASLLRYYQASEDRAATRTNSQLANQLVQYFLKNEPYCDPAVLNAMAKQMIGMFNVDMINQMFGQGGSFLELKNSVLFLTGATKDASAFPSEEKLSEMFTNAFKAEVAAPQVEQIAKEFLDASKIKAGKIKKEEDGYLGCKALTLSNGVMAYLYPTDVRKDRVFIDLIQDGGQSILPQELLPSFDDNVRYFYSANAGVGEFPANTVRKMLAGKSVGVSSYVNDTHSGINASSSTKDVETALQLLYLNFTQPRCDAKEFETTMGQMKTIAANLGSNPEYQYQMLLAAAETNNSPRTTMFGTELLEKVSAEAINKGNAMLFGDAVGAKVFVVGDFDPETIKPLLEKYVASLPVKSKKPRAMVDHRLYPADGENLVSKEIKMENPNTYASVIYQGPREKNIENSVTNRAMTYIMNMRYISSLREEDGGTYSPRVSGHVSPLPNERYYFSVGFETGKDKAQGLLDKVYAGIEALAADGPTDEELLKTIEMMKKNIPESKKNPNYWENLLQQYYLYGYDMNLTDEIIDKFVTKENVQKEAKMIVDKHNRLTVKVDPE